MNVTTNFSATEPKLPGLPYLASNVDQSATIFSTLLICLIFMCIFSVIVSICKLKTGNQ